ncbi:MAG: AbrB/MazE/SpoVT family DNA-binding domain-containing protein [Rubrivivax sp.]|nr:AbrB/MazE/SpoVT family DNA-binding domain-containing protein [Rubrivivax sp.]
MSAATLTAKGQIVIPAEIRARYGLTPGTQVEFADEGGVIRLVVRRRVAASDPEAGYGLIRIAAPAAGRPARRLSEFDPASLLKPAKAAQPARPGKRARAGK